MNNQDVQNQRREPNRGISCWTIIAIFFGVQLIMSLIGNANKVSQPQKYESTAAAPVLQNLLKPGCDLDVMVKVSNSSHILFQTRQIVQYSTDTPTIDVEFQLSNMTQLTQNITIAAYATVQGMKLDGQKITLKQTANLTAYKKIKGQTHSLISDHTMGVSPSGSKHITAIPTDFNVLIVYSDQFYPPPALPKMYGYRSVRAMDNSMYFLPPIDLNQIHIGGKHYHAPEGNHTVLLHIFCYSEYRYILFSSMGKKPQFSDPVTQSLMDAMNSPEAMDDMKEMLFQNNPWLVIITLVLSFLESIFSFLAIKNEIQFWRNIEKHQGMSMKILTTQLIFTIIMTLYLIDNDASKIVIVFELIQIPVCLWKIGKSMKIERLSTFPYVKLTRHEWYNKQIEQHDSKAIHYLYYFLVPAFMCYLVYQLIYGTYTGWYSFILETLVGFIVIFGFVMMTPQLYINYELKSVAHLPWRMLIYRFLKTIMDDLYAFLVTMPWLRRLSCFRDDIIFIVYIYQRCIYRTDHNRRQNPSNPNVQVRVNEAAIQQTSQKHEKSM